MDYSHLKGKDVKVVIDGEEFDCFVADISYEKGITLKDIENQRDKVCLNKKEAYTDQGYDFVYSEDFKYTVQQIKIGLLDSRVDPFTIKKGCGMTCAFE